MGECWGGIRVNQRECARRCLQVAEGRKGELDVGPVEAGTAVEEAAGLVKAQGQRAAARQQVVHAGPGLAPPGIELVVQGRYGGAVDQADVEVVLQRSEEHTSKLQSLMRISYAVFCLKKTNNTKSILV